MIEVLLGAKLATLSPNTYQLVAPTNYATPAIVFNRIGMESTRDTTDDLQEEGFVDFQIDVYSPRILEAKTVARSIKTALKGWQDPQVRQVVWASELPMVDNTTDVELFRVKQEFRFYVREL